MEENLSSLRRSRDQQGGKIEAQERKVRFAIPFTLARSPNIDLFYLSNRYQR